MIEKEKFLSYGLALIEANHELLKKLATTSNLLEREFVKLKPELCLNSVTQAAIPALVTY